MTRARFRFEAEATGDVVRSRIVGTRAVLLDRAPGEQSKDGHGDGAEDDCELAPSGAWAIDKEVDPSHGEEGGEQ